MNTQDRTVSDTPATQLQSNMTEYDISTDEHSVVVPNSLQPDMFAPEQLQFAL